ncbi:MAG: MTAP family purine nucleoside phosphorylase [Methanosarcinaceae archaeon]|nr:MTAP family purine nucleoside phosphorylase [Methanosarcinaceae archaeon]
MSVIGIIGGTGVYNLELDDPSEVEVETPFGKPSDSITLGKLGGRDVAFIPRHGRYHQLLPHEINYRANIYALKKMGVEQVISTCMAGSLKKEIKPGQVVIPDQTIDLTKTRDSTFFGDGVAAYVDMSEPFCSSQSKYVADTIAGMGIDVHKGGTYVCIEGPQFSTYAESDLYVMMGGDIVGMTALPEVKLAREAEMCYVSIVGISDYNVCGMTSSCMENMKGMRLLMKNMRSILSEVVLGLHVSTECSCSTALGRAIVTSGAGISSDTILKLDSILGKYEIDTSSIGVHGSILK